MDLPQFLRYIYYGASECAKLVFDNLSTQDIANLRLTCKTIHQATASCPLVRRVYISSHRADLDAFRTITGNPILAQHIEEIVWDDTTFNRLLLDYKVYKPIWQCSQLYEDVLRQAFEIWKDLVEEHLRIREQQLDFQALVEALPNLPSLKKVTLTRLSLGNVQGPASWTFRGRPQLMKSPAMKHWLAIPYRFRKFMSMPSVQWHWQNWRYQNSYPSAVSEVFSPEYRYDGMSPDLLNFFDDWDGDDYSFYAEAVMRSPAQPAPVYSPFRGLILLARAIDRTATRLDEFQVLDQDGGGISLQYFQDQNPEFETLLRALRPVRHLSLDTDGDGSPLTVRYETGDALVSMLSSLNSLQSLYLRVDWPEFFLILENGSKDPLGIRLPHLKEVTISTWRDLDSSHLSQILSWCKSLTQPLDTTEENETTRERLTLRLSNIGLNCNTSWDTVFQEIKTTPEIYSDALSWLQKLDLQNVSDRALRSETKRAVDYAWFSSDNAVLEYISGKGPFPLKAGCMYNDRVD